MQNDKEIHGQDHNSEAATSSARQEIPHIYTTQKFIIVSVRAHHLSYCEPD